MEPFGGLRREVRSISALFDPSMATAVTTF